MTRCAIPPCPNPGTVPVLRRDQHPEEAQEWVCSSHYARATRARAAFEPVPNTRDIREPHALTSKTWWDCWAVPPRCLVPEKDS